SNHYPFTFGHRYNWAVLAGLALGAIAVRHYLNRQEKGFNPVWLPLAAAVILIALTLVTQPASLSGGQSEKPVAFSTVQAIINRRCTSCHSAHPTDDVFRVAPLGAKFDTPQEIKRQILKIKARTIDTTTMPLANKTHMTDKERTLLARWVAQGASITD
ncbi:MAG: urate hydroxylase PuuD, partial [Candidatus Tectomicrobia bacterium]|nr:urate hydroxylase PuuD [Candidatus Tectomicrobia bacterium]